MLVASVYLLDIVDAARAVGTHGGNQQGDTCSDIRARHSSTTKFDLPVVAYDNSAMGVAEDDLGTHVDEFVNEEQAALKHLLVEKHAASCL
jgi:hypothetical protein